MLSVIILNAVMLSMVKVSLFMLIASILSHNADYH